MTSKQNKALVILQHRINVLQARVNQDSPERSNYHELREELSAMKTVRGMVQQMNGKQLLTQREIESRCRAYYEERRSNEAEMDWFNSANGQI